MMNRPNGKRESRKREFLHVHPPEDAAETLALEADHRPGVGQGDTILRLYNHLALHHLLIAFL